jgi:microsomal dipeptidase-like Zn-dependent dipeptidase
MRVETLGFLSPQGQPPEADPSLGLYVDLMHVTAAPPMLKSAREIINGNGRFPGLKQFRGALEIQDPLTIVESASDLAGLEEADHTGIILGLQETPHDISRESLQEMYGHGIRIMTPSYQDADHPLGSGYTDPHGPLTDAGRDFLADCEETGMIIDLSHLGHQAARDVLDFREEENLSFPVFASHGGVYELFHGKMDSVNNARNLPWDVLERVTEVGGTVGMYALTFALSEKDNTTTPLTNQIVAAERHLGEGAVTIGTDTVYQYRDMGEWRESTEWLTRQLAGSGQLNPRFPDYPIELNGPDKLLVIEDKLVAAGLARPEAEAVVGRNAADFFERSLPA